MNRSPKPPRTTSRRITLEINGCKGHACKIASDLIEASGRLKIGRQRDLELRDFAAAVTAYLRRCSFVRPDPGRAGGNRRNNEIRSYQVALESARGHDDEIAAWTFFSGDRRRCVCMCVCTRWIGTRQPTRESRCIF